MILHLITDSQFAEYVYNQYSNNDKAEIIVISDSDTLKFIKRSNCKIVNPNSKGLNSLIKNICNYKAIVLHGLFYEWQQYILERIPKNIVVAWMFWGGEIYGRTDLKCSFLAPRTMLMYKIHLLKNLLLKKIKNATDFYEISISLLKRIDFCLTGIEEEYAFAKSYISSDLHHIWYTYYSIEETLGALINEETHGDNIWVGNSATIECNYLDAFHTLYSKDIENKCIYAPLSYGQTWVRKIVQKFGHYYFDKKFIPMFEYLPRIEYNKMMLSCGTMIMAHYRPQAQGNILTGLWLGMKVYLSEKSMTYTFFRRIGVFIFSIEQDLKNSSTPFKPLSKEERQHNRKILLDVYGKESVLSHSINVLNILDK